MKILTLILICAFIVSRANAADLPEFIGESETRVLKSLAKLPKEVHSSYDPAVKVATRENWSIVSDSQDQIMEHLIEALTVMQSRKGDLDLESHRKKIKLYRDTISDFWRVETKSLIDDEAHPSAFPSMRLDTFLVRHLTVRLLFELREFQKDSEESAGKISVLSSDIYKEVNAALVWLEPLVDKTFSPPTQLPEHFKGKQ